MNYRIGLYLDNDKIGWAAIRENEEGHAEHLERIGVRFFPIAENIALPNCANYSVKLVCLL